jgi:hypothetical protein
MRPISKSTQTLGCLSARIEGTSIDLPQANQGLKQSKAGRCILHLDGATFPEIEGIVPDRNVKHGLLALTSTFQVKLTVQKEVYSGVILQQAFAVELVVHNFQCTNCHMVAADNTWRAVVQVRQKVLSSQQKPTADMFQSC